MNIVAGMTVKALDEHGVRTLPAYRRALVSACNEYPPLFGKRPWRELYRRSARDPEWVALSLATSSQSEGQGAQHLWDMAASTPDPDIAGQIKRHAIDEARHSRVYVTLLDLVFPGTITQQVRTQLRRLSPGYSTTSPLSPRKGSPYARAATVDELIQMNIAEIRTRTVQLLQRPVLLAYCDTDRRAQVRRILDALLYDETRHIAYTARLIERSALESGVEHIVALMQARVRDFNEFTKKEVARRTLGAA